MTHSRLAAIGIFGLLTVLAVGNARGELPTGGTLAPAVCSAGPCRQGFRMYHLHEYGKAARAWQKAVRTLPGGPMMWESRIDLLIMTGSAWEESDRPTRAGLSYLKASRLVGQLRPYLEFKAAQNLIHAAHPPIELLDLIASGEALEEGFAGSDLLAARIDALGQSPGQPSAGLPSVRLARAALDSSSHDQACQWLSGLMAETDASDWDADSTGRLANTVYGLCLPKNLSAEFQKLAWTPSDRAQLRRADHWYAAVQFPQAHEEMAKVDRDALDPVHQCQADFRRGRILYRLRKRTQSMQAYRRVIDACHTDANEDQRVRALYAVGRRQFRRHRLTASKKLFDTLLDDYPERSHADDALLYLARIAREQHDDAGEHKIVTRALRDYPDGDMVGELAWEYLEAPYRSGRYKDFLAKLAALSLPETDEQYFSQGRLEYFKARAFEQTGHPKRARAAWQRAWTTYPFSFYGYLSRQRLVGHDAVPHKLADDLATGVADWFDDPDWRASGADRLAQLGLYEMASDVEDARLAASNRTPSDRWRLAYLKHAAGQFPVSHNIARRSIPGRPWAAPASARRLRWTIAWPNPFGIDIRRAVVAERRQATDGEYVEPALPAAIMREESSFIEDIESWAGALGLMQLMPATARDHDDDIDGIATPARLKTSLVNIRVGVDHLFYLASRFDSQPVLIAAAYNAGGGAVSGWIRRHHTDDIGLFVEDIPYDQTRNYTKRVIGSYAAYQWLAGIRELDPAIAQAP